MTENKHDWKETDDLLAQLRAKIQEDISAHTEPTSADIREEVSADETAVPLDASAKEATAITEPAQEQLLKSPEETPKEPSVQHPAEMTATEAVEASGEEPVEMPIEELSGEASAAEEVILPPEKHKKKRRKKRQQPEEEDELAWIDSKPIPAAAEPSAKVEPVTEPVEKPVAEPSVETAPVADAESAPSTPSVATRHTGRSGKAPRRRVNTHIPSSRRDAGAEDIAELTVEGLVDDIFGSARRAVGGNWYDSTAAAESVSDETASADETLMSQSHASAEDAEKARLVPGAPATVTEARDGQISFVLPETGRAEEQVTDVEEETGYDGHKLFSAFAIGGAQERGRGHTDADREDKDEFKRSVESSEEDFQLLMDLDYEDELGNAIGFDKIREYRELGVNGAVQKKRKRKKAERTEFEFQGQDIYFRKRYAKQKTGHVLRLALSLVLLLFIFIYEHPSWLPGLFKGPIDGANFPRPYVMLGIQLLLLDAALVYKRLGAGLSAVLRLDPNDDSFCVVTALVTFVYHFILLFLPATGVAPVLYLSPAAMVLALLALSDLLDWYRESAAFRVVSNRRQKYALISRISVGGNRNNARARLLEEEQNERLWYARPVGFVRNYFGNTEKRAEHRRSLGLQLLLVFAVCVACGIFRFAAGARGAEILQTLMATLMYCFPAITLLVTTLPMFLGTVLRLKGTCAIIGEEPVYSSGERTKLVLPDGEVFDRMSHEQFELVEDCDIQQTLILVRALLDRIESPLAHSVHVDMELRIPCEKTELLEIASDGVSALVGEKKHAMLFGSVEYLRAHGVAVRPRGGEAGEIHKRMLLVSVDGKVSAIFLAKYRFSGKMQEFLAGIRGEDIPLMVRTKDPGVHNDLFEALQPDEKNPIRVMKPTATEVDIHTDRVDATIVALGSCREAVKAFFICRRIRRAGLFGKLLHGLSMIFGGVIAALAAIFHPAWLYNPAIITAYILFWCLLHLGFSYFYLRGRE